MSVNKLGQVTDMDALTDAGITESEPILITLRQGQCVVFRKPQ